MSIRSEFKAFIARGNVVDLAVGVIIGTAFGKITTSFVNDVIMPPIGLVLGKVDFSNLFINLSGDHFATLAEAKKAGAPTINYGMFINSLLDFIIIAFVIFFVVRAVNRLTRRTEAAPTTRECPRCCEAIPIKASRCPRCTSELVTSSPAPVAAL